MKALALKLREYFPELGTDEELNGGDAVDRLNELLIHLESSPTSRNTDTLNASWDFYRICWIGGYGADQEIDAYIRLRSDFAPEHVTSSLLASGLFSHVLDANSSMIVEAFEEGFKISIRTKAGDAETRPYFSLARQTEEDISQADWVNDEYTGLPKA